MEMHEKMPPKEVGRLSLSATSFSPLPGRGNNFKKYIYIKNTTYGITRIRRVSAISHLYIWLGPSF